MTTIALRRVGRWGVFAAALLAGAMHARAVPAITEEDVLRAGDGAPLDKFGGAVAVRGDVAVVGAPGLYSGSAVPGAVYVFTRSASGIWSQTVKLTASDGVANDHFGDYLAVGDGTILVGADGRNQLTGAVYVFTGGGASWTLQAKLTAGDGAPGDRFGACALDGDTAVVGAHGAGGTHGAAYVFTRAGATWTQRAKLVPSGSALDYAGAGVALSGDTAALATGTGAVAYVFTRTGTTWSQRAALKANGGATPGRCVALEGDTLLTGALAFDYDVGSAYVFARAGGVWTQQAELAGGGSAALSGDTAVVGLGTGANVYTRTGQTWAPTGTLATSDGAGVGYFAVSGPAVLAGTPGWNDLQGAVVAFRLVGPPPPPPPTTGQFLLPTKITRKVNPNSPAKDVLTLTATLDTGPAPAAFDTTAALSIGGVAVPIAELARDGKGVWRYRDALTRFAIVPGAAGGSRCAVTATVKGAQVLAVDTDGTVELSLSCGNVSATGACTLKRGAFTLGHGALPVDASVPRSARVTLAGPGRDSFTVKWVMAPSEPAPQMSDIVFRFGPSYAKTIPGASFKRRGTVWSFADRTNVLPAMTLDTATGFVTVTGRKADLGTFATGAQAVRLVAGPAADPAIVDVRMVRRGRTLTY